MAFTKIFRLFLLLWMGGLSVVGMFLFPNAAKATHIVGAELYYECLNPSANTYYIRLRMLRDCQFGEAPFDEVISLFLFPTNNPGDYRIIDIPKPPNTPQIINTGWELCVQSTAQPCVEEGIYETVTTLQPIPGGYDIGWARCCRNSNIDNLVQPLNQGVTFLAHLPGPEHATCNSMATFDQSLPTFICASEDFYFDHSATDADGDSLVYALTWPYDGINMQNLGAGNPNVGGNQPIVDINNPMGPPPYRNVTFAPGFSFNSPFGLPPTAEINSQTGRLHFNAPNIGVFVIAISVFEFRNGILIAENKKDLQLRVLQCFPQNDPPIISHTFSPQDSVVGDTVVIIATDTACYHVTIFDPDSSQLAIQTLSAIFTGPDAPTLTVTGNNPLEIDICWESDCGFAGTSIELILMGYDLTNCPIYNPAFDTVYIKIIPPPETRPEVGHQLPPQNPLGPDTLLLEVDSTACFPMWVLDPLGGNGPISYTYSVADLSGGTPMILSVFPDPSDADSLALMVCATGGCENRERLYRVVVRGTLEGVCPPDNFAQDTLYIYVPPVPNPAPVVSPDLSGNILNADTILVDVHDSICFTVSVNDTFPGLGLDLEATLSALDGQAAGGFQPMLTILSVNDSLVMQVCWYAVCDNVNRLFRIVLEGRQDNRCTQSAFASDTVYVRVQDVFNPPPILSHSIDTALYRANGDTILIAADSAACFDFELRDQGDNVFLEITQEVQLLPGLDPTGHGATVTYSLVSDTLLQGEICLVPGCEYLDQTLMVVMAGRDTFDCSEIHIVRDTVYVRAVAPVNNPPVVNHDLSGLQFSGNLVQSVPIGEPYCYRVTVSDPDSTYAQLTATGVGNIFQEWWRYGNPAAINVSGSNPLNVTVCWDPNCYDSGETFSIVICARDTSRCGLAPTVCDTVRFNVNACSLFIGNVFTPNGDGINDEFVPYNAMGVDYYRMQVYDRWGRILFTGDNQGWNGGMKGDGSRLVPDGVYYFDLEYQLFSARGVPLKTRQVGHVTMMR
jgi:gliding motility-associated-like protein